MYRSFYSGMETDLPLLALFLFLAVFAAVVAYVVRRGPRAFEGVSTLPLADDTAPQLRPEVKP